MLQPIIESVIMEKMLLETAKSRHTTQAEIHYAEVSLGQLAARFNIKIIQKWKNHNVNENQKRNRSFGQRSMLCHNVQVIITKIWKGQLRCVNSTGSVLNNGLSTFGATERGRRYLSFLQNLAAAGLFVRPAQIFHPEIGQVEPAQLSATPSVARLVSHYQKNEGSSTPSLATQLITYRLNGNQIYMDQRHGRGDEKKIKATTVRQPYCEVVEAVKKICTNTV